MTDKELSTAHSGTSPPIRSKLSANPTVRIWLFTIAVAIGALVLLAGSGLRGSSLLGSPWWTAVVVTVGYVIANRFQLRLEYRDDTVFLAVTEVPTAFALLFLDPVTAVIARLVGTLPLLIRKGRHNLDNSVFNAVMLVFEIAVAFRVLEWVTGGSAPSDLRIVVAILLAVFSALTTSFVGVCGALACGHGRFFGTLREELPTAAVLTPTIASTATFAAIPALLDQYLVALGLISTCVIWFAVDRYSLLDRKHRNLRRVHDVTQAAGHSLRPDEIASLSLPVLAEALRAGRASMQILNDSGEVLAEHQVNASVDVSFSPQKNIEVDIYDFVGRLGVLRFNGRTGAARAFVADDRILAKRYAAQLAPILRNALLYAEIERLALSDPLTGAVNRRGFDQAVVTALDCEPEPESELGALVLDLDRFKEINDTFGHQVGDQVLKLFADRVRALLQPGDVFGRLGGDEFAVLVRRQRLGDACALADRIAEDSAEPFVIDGLQIVVAASVGLAIAKADDDAAHFIGRADTAMYAAKKTHVGFEMFSIEMDRSGPERLRLVTDLRSALKSEELDIALQPKICLRTSTVVAAEALVRWTHPTKGSIDPPDVVKVAEESGLIRQLTDQVL